MRESEETETNHEVAEEDTAGNRQDERNEHNHASEQSDEEGIEDDIFHPSDRPLSTIPCDGDPLVGRIGTLATITFTHEETASSVNPDQAGTVEETTSSRVWHNSGDELVLTVLGTKRVRLMRSIRDKKRDQTASVPLYAVEVIRDESTIPPPLWMLQSPGIKSPVTTRSFIGSDSFKEHSDEERNSEEEMVGITDYDTKAIQSLSSLTSLPTFAYQTIWPCKLCRKICKLIQDTEQFKGLCDILQSAAGLRFDNTSNTETQKIPFQVVDPSTFSDWLASNVPLSFNERMDMLEMICTIDRLRFILKKLEKRKKEQSSIRCKHCGATISQMRQIFSVGGSEGTAGAYVNCHGIIHHTMTLRDIDKLLGQPETKDSWFPGYSWQISYCAICHDHLGWKFRKVNQRSDENDYDLDRPKSFWGFSSVTTDDRDAQPRRVQFQR